MTLRIVWDWTDARRLFFNVVAAGSLLAGVTQHATGETLRLGHITPPSHVWHQVSQRIAGGIEEATDGAMTVKVAPLQRLGNEGQMVNLLQSGAMQIGVLTAAGLANREQSFLAWFLPYSFRDVEHATHAASTDAAREMLARLEPHGMIGLGYVFAGMRHVLATAPILSPRDLAKRKIRSFPSPIFNDWWRANGAAPTALPLSEVAPSLTTRLLDAVDVDLDALVGLKFHHQAPNLTLTNHMAFPAAIVVSARWWQSLGETDRAAVLGAVAAAEAWGFQAAISADEKNLAFAVADGALLVETDLAAFRAVGKEVRDRYLGKDARVAVFYQQVTAL